ncbi:MAG: aminopeptidase N [Rhodocyclaceae bacterium]
MNAPASIYLKDYTPPAYLIDTVDLDVAIFEGHARVGARLAVRRNPAGRGGPLVLNGEGLTLESVSLNERALPADAWRHADDLLTLADVPDAFVLHTVVRVDPDNNLQLSGLYRSKDGYFTQCEAEGFRRITFYLDRPDVMARFTCTLHADKARFPVLLSNGNPVGQGDEGEGRHWARWEDPFPKPAYLFACVAAKLEVKEEFFTTASGRRVRCAVYVEPGKLDQVDHALAAIQKSMKWDEDTFGLEMDLDHYMIVAVGDFNMGAMENKGLNIFNTKYVLASPATATDADFDGIESVIGHEYFHNWTGNRVTCRDWFQLSLKEGLTVFRDQQFGMDVHSAGVTRIQEVRLLRAAQFPEDAGPMAHPIRPASYAEINNFYTATVYEKGAEVVRMIHTLIGKDAFRRGMDLYFERHDGQAVTCEDFVAAMQSASGLDLTQFKRWYNQAGTPHLVVRGDYDATAQTYALEIEQQYPLTAYEERMAAEGNPVPRGPYHIPVALGFIGESGQALAVRLEGEAQADAGTRVLSVTQDMQRFVFTEVAERPTLSLLRGFSAPVTLDFAYHVDALIHLMAHDTDPIARWDAGQRLATRILLDGVHAYQRGKGEAGDWIPAAYADAMRALLLDAFATGGDPALVAESFILPSETVIGEEMDIVDPDAIHAARSHLRRHIAQALADDLQQAYVRLRVTDAYSPDALQAGQRALRNQCLGYLSELESMHSNDLVVTHFNTASNMTDSIAALGALANLNVPGRREALDSFYASWQHEALVVDKWLMAQATSRLPGTGAAVRALMAHEAFDIKNPNKVYSLIRAFCAANPKHFHAADGSGYALAADVVIALDAMNPQVAARIARTFDRWKKFDAARQAVARAQLERIQSHAGLSRDVAEVVGKALASA